MGPIAETLGLNFFWIGHTIDLAANTKTAKMRNTILSRLEIHFSFERNQQSLSHNVEGRKEAAASGQELLGQGDFFRLFLKEQLSDKVEVGQGKCEEGDASVWGSLLRFLEEGPHQV